MFGAAALCAILLCIINCALPEMQILLTGGSVPVPQAVIKLCCFGFLIALMLFYRRLNLAYFPTTTWIIAIGYLLIEVPYLWIWQNKAPSEIFLAYNAYYASLIIAPTVASLLGKLQERLATKIFLAAFVACAALGWAQFILQEPLIDLASDDGNFRIYESQWMVGGDRSLRANSFFGFAQDYGSFAVIIACLAIGMCGRRNHWKWGVPLYLFAAACCYTTLTRATYVQLLVATVAALIFTFGKRRTRAIWVPLLALGLGLVLAFGGISTLIKQKNSMYDDASLQQRLTQWHIAQVTFENSSTEAQLFGFGFCQADKPAIIARREGGNTVLIDNMFVALIMHIGVLGMLAITALMCGIWLSLRRMAIDRPTPLVIGLASFWSTFALIGMFNIQMTQYGFWFLAALVVAGPTNQNEEVRAWLAHYEPDLVGELQAS
jgi:hypothetical protein